jgi:hypothetical protein
MNRIPSLLGILLGAIVAISEAGCSGSSQPALPAEAVRLNKIGAICEEYKEAKKTYPTTLEELKSWAIENGKATDADFKSSRDNEPYVLEPMGRGGAPTQGGPVLIREATGKNGKKFVFTGVRAEEMGDQSLGYIRGQTPKMIQKGKSK